MNTWTTAWLLLWGCGGSASTTPTAFVAASTDAAFAEVLGDFGPARTSAASSSVLARQITAGAPADLFLSANSAWADTLRPLARVDLLGNRLVVVVPAGHQPPAVGPQLGAQGCLAMGDPDHVPGGQYAREALIAAGLWADLSDKVLPTMDAPSAALAVAHGACQVGIVYRTDAVRAELVQGELLTGAPVVYPLLLLQPKGQQLYDYLQGPEASAVFRRHGFVVPP